MAELDDTFGEGGGQILRSDIKPRKILHLDLDAFYCSVEEQLNPSLRGLPTAVGGSPEGRGVVASCSYAARLFGVRSAMPTARALRLCPDLLLLKGQHKRYSKVSKQVMDYLRANTPLVEQLSIDEAFLDVSNISKSVVLTAQDFQKVINKDFDLPCSIGVASNKLMAKIANNIGKSAASKAYPPNAITFVPIGEEAEFLAPLPVIAMWGVGPKTAERMKNLGIQTIGDLANQREEELIHQFGKLGKALTLRARGIDNRPIVTHHEAKSISQEITFSKDSRSEKSLTRTLIKLSEKVGKRLRANNKTAATVKLKIRWPDFTTLSRQITCEEPIDKDEQIFSAANQLFHKVWKPGRPVRLIGVGVSGLGSPIRQLSLWNADDDREYTDEKRLREIVADLREKFGDQILFRGFEFKRIQEDKDYVTRNMG